MTRLQDLEYKAQSAINAGELKVYEKEIKLIIERGAERSENNGLKRHA
ncbi:hypothetical protein HGO21_03260 [Acinetobacter sp. CUI P1]|nr:hypothetical protein [Acinetobacter sp. CUI P1]